MSIFCDEIAQLSSIHVFHLIFFPITVHMLLERCDRIIESTLTDFLRQGTQPIRSFGDVLHPRLFQMQFQSQLITTSGLISQFRCETLRAGNAALPFLPELNELAERTGLFLI